ncbi:hypothetical protein ACEN4P_10150 [Marinilactibacillus psychrotolerans]|uniref:DUF4305 domain-containing protein n=2 Tax=Marinilactibacillus psychrotolerans TaxID=191770 RepID=A0A511GZH4_9LACT|nr:hypothetical protein [Marinilactibacillus psychrotolerans]TLQ09684.1 DUF4305 domain-containing protein [Marinilactibacillus psychrotolerans]SDD24713.1 hypothetical protein SAMN04488013_12242 [Marinilactibacillus psychrotolerans]SJN30660.1 hypothetical protein FM115_05195 [Marinilactibacillus psychrotolerans 42ea]GEL66677.1 hypothetical protein MPS01_08320 [Marinilactibacillus psychrotolerans]GEQ33248.1 hypothetical protein B795N_11300 [Marinilactibacillus psychrotolerans]
MTEKQILSYIFLKYAMGAILLYFIIDIVGLEGWGIFPLLFAFLATKDFVQGTRLADSYFKIRKNRDK